MQSYPGSVKSAQSPKFEGNSEINLPDVKQSIKEKLETRALNCYVIPDFLSWAFSSPVKSRYQVHGLKNDAYNIMEGLREQQNALSEMGTKKRNLHLKTEKQLQFMEI